MKKKSIILLIVMFLIIIIAAFLVYKIIWPMNKTYSIVNKIELSDEFKLYFFNNGFCTQSQTINFYDFDCNNIDNPITDLELQHTTINKSTDNFMLINNKYIYNSYNSPFKRIYSTDEKYKIIDIKELDSYLLILASNIENLETKLISYDKETSFIREMDIRDSTYLDCDSSASSYYALVTIDESMPTPSNRVYQYDSDMNSYGAILHYDKIYSRIFKLNDYYILVDAHGIDCFSTEGTKVWNLEAGRPSIIKNGNEIIVYTPLKASNNLIHINKDVEKQETTIEKNLYSLQKSTAGYFAYKNNTIYIFDNSFKESTKINNKNPIINLYTTPRAPSCIYVVDNNNDLIVYSTSTN